MVVLVATRQVCGGELLTAMASSSSTALRSAAAVAVAPAPAVSRPS
uniref:Uncharacterized protein n=2 Tax=Setaria italica TaxID=4555 RepID=K4A3P6_SETIT